MKNAVANSSSVVLTQQSRSKFEDITTLIVEAIETGKASYEMPWCKAQNLIPFNVSSNKSYRGINTVTLWAVASASQYEQASWGTYKQWQELGCQVKKGEKSAPVVYWDTYKDDEYVFERGKSKSFMRSYAVFNAGQVDGFCPPTPTKSAQNEAIASAEAFFINLCSDIRTGGNLAGYSKTGDFIKMPSIQQFLRSEGYYSVLSHEHIHWSGHKSRLNRDLSGRFGDAAYAMEELAAELGAAFLCAHLGVKTEPRTDHAGYIQTWLSVLRGDQRAIFAAAAAAQKAVDYLVDESQNDPVLVGQGLVNAAKRIFNLTVL